MRSHLSRLSFAFAAGLTMLAGLAFAAQISASPAQAATGPVPDNERMSARMAADSPANGAAMSNTLPIGLDLAADTLAATEGAAVYDAAGCTNCFDIVFEAPIAVRAPAGEDNPAVWTTRGLGKTLKTNDPISAGSGAYEFSQPLLALNSLLPLDVDLFHQSQSELPPSDALTTWLPTNFRWSPFVVATINYDLNGKTWATILFPDGDQVAFKKVGSDWVLVEPNEVIAGVGTLVDNGSRVPYVLQETTEYAYLMDPIAERVYIFQKLSGEATRIVRFLDRNNNALIYSYAAGADRKPARIEDGLGRTLDLAYATVGTKTYLQRITDQGGRQITFTYEAAAADNSNRPTLRSVTDALGNTTTLSYARGDKVASRQLPRGNAPVTQTYTVSTLNGSLDNRVATQQDALGNTTTLSYTANSNTVMVQQPDGATRVFEHHSSYSLPKVITDTNGAAAQFTKNSDEQLTSVTDRLGATSVFSYHLQTGKLLYMTNAKNNTINYAYTAQDQTFTNPLNSETITFTFYNPTRVDYPTTTSALQRIDDNEQFTYDANGNVLTHTDRAGQVWTYTYNGRGQVLTATNPRGGVATFIYNADATLASSKDSDADAVTTCTYDAHKRLIRITHPDATFVQIAYDANDNVTSLTDENNRTTTFAYDANDNLVSVTDAVGQVANLSYDLMDRVASSANRLNQTTTYTYDALGRLASVADPTSIATTFGYDPGGWLNAITRGGQTWQTAFDAEGIPTQQMTPLGFATRYQSDALGFTTVVTNPLGAATRIGRDALNRITRITDPLGRATDYTYDAHDLLAGVTLPASGAVTYTRNALGDLTRITDLNGSRWDFGYTAMGRLRSLTDPLGRVITHTYDTRDRLAQTTFPDGATLMRTYDAASNLTALVYSGGPALNFTYDAPNRLTAANDLALAYDAEGRITHTQDGADFGATYDDAGRVKTVTYNNGAFTVTYTYGATNGLLAQVHDSLTGTQIHFTYDNARRLIGVTRPNGVNTTYAWDDAARLTRIRAASGGNAITDLQYTLDAAGQVTQLAMIAPLDPSASLVGQVVNLSYDAAAQISSTGYAYDARGRLTASPGITYTWDGASRLVGVGQDDILSYNGLGDLRTRTQGGAPTHYYYNYALGLSPIVAEFTETADASPFAIRHSSSAIPLRYYVWTPGGQLLYMIEAAAGNQVYHYHFDRTGSTLALTDGSGAVTDAYAYDPYGRLLAHTGANTQPFTFVGQWGVRQEGASGALYHMRARYYDATTGRFISRDPVWPQVADTRELDPYLYALDDPIQKGDPAGASVDLNDV